MICDFKSQMIHYLAQMIESPKTLRISLVVCGNKPGKAESSICECCFCVGKQKVFGLIAATLV